MKNGSKNKLLTCFKPIVVDPDDHSIINYSSDDQLCLVSDMISDSDRKPTFRRSFSGAFKSALFQSSLSRKFRENKIRRSKSYSDTISLKARADAISNSPTSSSSSYPNSSSGSDNLGVFIEDHDDHDDEREVEEQEQEQKEEVIVRKSSVKLNHVMYLVVISLLVTILWGKLSAMTVTTVWIFIVPILSQGLNLKESALVGFLRKKLSSRSLGSWLKMLHT